MTSLTAACAVLAIAVLLIILSYIAVRGFSSLSLQFLIDKYPPLVARLERAPGTKEPRYGQLLGGEITIVAGSEQVNSAAAGMTQGGRIGQLEQEVAALRGELEDLKAQFEAFRQQFQ